MMPELDSNQLILDRKRRDEEHHRAALYVCGMQALDVDDARLLLAILDLP